MVLYALPVSIRTETYSGRGVSILYPRVIQMRDREVENRINQEIIAAVRGLIDKQEATGTYEMTGTYEVKTNERTVLSLSLSNYTYVDHAAHGMTYMTSMTLDTQTGKRFRLKDLFKPGADYVGKISTLVKRQLENRNIYLLQPFDRIRANQDFYIADKALMIYFQLYEISPYAYGFPMFPISVFELLDIIDEEGPLGQMAVNR